MSAVTDIFKAPKPDASLEADRLAAKREAEQAKAKADAKAANLRSARMGGTVGFSSLLSAGTAGGGQPNKKSLLG